MVKLERCPVSKFLGADNVNNDIVYGVKSKQSPVIFSRLLQGIGCTKITRVRNEGSVNGNSESRSYLEKKLVFCFGSHIAAQMLLPFGEENLLSSSELTQAQEVDFILCFVLFKGINI